MEEDNSSKIFFLKFFVISIFVLIMAVAYALFADNTQKSVVSEDKISIDVSISNFVNSGEVAMAQVSVTNKNNSAIRAAKIEINYEESISPAGEVYMNKISLDVGDVGALSVVNKEAKFIFVGKQEDIRKINAKLSYSVDGSSAVFVKDYKNQTKINNNIFLVNIYGRSEVIENLDTFYKVDLKNVSPQEFKNLFLKVELPKEFNIYSSSSEKIAKVFPIASIKAGETISFDFSGYFKNVTNEKRNFRAYVYSQEVGEKVLAYSQLETQIVTSPVELILTAEVEDQKVQTLTLGKDATLGFIITNIGDYAMDELSILLNIDNKQKIVYSSEENPKLKRLNPKDNISFEQLIKSVKASSTEISVNIFGKIKGEFDEVEILKQSYILKAQ